MTGRVTAADLFDRFVDTLGQTQAAEVMNQIFDVVRGHTECSIMHVQIDDTGTDLDITLVHQQDCPYARRQ
jgi:hypothetical protein